MTSPPADRGQHPRQGGTEAQPPLGPLRAAALPCRRPEGRRGRPRGARLRRRGLRHRRPPPSSTPTLAAAAPPLDPRRRPRAGLAQRQRHPGRCRRRSAASSTGPVAHVARRRRGCVAICADVRDPGNAGTVIRCADAAGADGVVLAGHSVDVYNPKTVRATVGSLFHLPIAIEPDPAAAVRAARAAGLQVLAADGAGEVDLDDADELLAAPTAWLFGNEAWGLPAELAALADHRVRIPIHGRAESLNLSTAAALCLYASARAQRRLSPAGTRVRGVPARRRSTRSPTARSLAGPRRAASPLVNRPRPRPAGRRPEDAVGLPARARCSRCRTTTAGTGARQQPRRTTGCRPGPRCPSSPGCCPTAPRCWSSARIHRPALDRPVEQVAVEPALRPRPGPARPRALRPGRDRRPRAALAADRRQGLRAGAAEPLGQAQRRAEEADAHHRQRRLRPAEPADRRAARRRPHRHRPARSSTRGPATRRCWSRRVVESVAAGTAAPIALDAADGLPRGAAPTPTSSPRWSPTWSRTPSATATGVGAGQR